MRGSNSAESLPFRHCATSNGLRCRSADDQAFDPTHAASASRDESPDTELTAAFAGAAILIALWSIGTGLVGLRETVRQPRRIGSIANT